MCSDCLNCLSVLYEAYVGFMGLTAEGSSIQQLMKSSVLCTSLGLEFNSDDNGGSLSTLINVKVEEDDMDDDLVRMEMETADPDFICDVENLNLKCPAEEQQIPFLRRSTRSRTTTSSRSDGKDSVNLTYEIFKEIFSNCKSGY